MIENFDLCAEEKYQKGVSFYHASNFQDAADYFIQAAIEQYPAAYLYLSCIYQQSLFENKKQRAYFLQMTAKNIHWFQTQANKENASGLAQNNLGYIYDKGIGVPQNHSEAARLFKLAADQGMALAQYNLGYFYQNGLGVVEQNYKEAARLFKLAADQGFASAQNNLAYLYQNGLGVEQNYTEAARLYKLAADQGLAVTQYNLGYLYEEGLGVKKDYKKAARLYILAANQGNKNAQYFLGRLNEQGLGVEKNYREAARLYKLAANQGNKNAQYRLGHLYENSFGVNQDYIEAERLYTLAADHGIESALQALINLGRRCEEEGHLKEAERLYRLAADCGSRSVIIDLFDLGLRYEEGYKVEKNDKEAERLYRLAAEFGDENTQEILFDRGDRYEKGRAEERDYCKAARLYALAGRGGEKQQLKMKGKFTTEFLGLALIDATKKNNNNVVKMLLGCENIDVNFKPSLMGDTALEIAQTCKYTEIQDCIAEAKVVKYIKTVKEALDKGIETDGLGTGISKNKKLAAAEAFLAFYRNNGNADISQHIEALTENGILIKSNLFEIICCFSKTYTARVFNLKNQTGNIATKSNFSPSFWDNNIVREIVTGEKPEVKTHDYHNQL